MAYPLNAFDFITNENDRQMYDTALHAITDLELWDFMKQQSDTNFMFSNSPEINQIYNKIEELGYTGHSGCSFTFTMHKMKYIADNGLDELRKQYMLHQ